MTSDTASAGTVGGLLFLALALLAAPACQVFEVHEGPAPGVRVRNRDAPQAGIRYNTVQVIDKSLQNWNGTLYDPPWVEYLWSTEDEKYARIAVESTNARRTETGTLEVWAVLRNRTDVPIQIEGRSQFFDDDKRPSDGPTAWQRVQLPPQSVATYRELSAGVADVAYYYIEIREGR